MKAMMMFGLSSLLVGQLAFAADAENNATESVDHSKNPITGTETTTKKTRRTVKQEGASHDVKMTEKTKLHKDGSVEKSVKAEGEGKTETK